MSLPKALLPLVQDDRWVVWKSIKRGDVWTKPPFDPKRPDKYADVTKSATWGTYQQADRVARKMEERGGVGYVLPPCKPGKVFVCGLDFDNCRDPKKGTIKPWAQQLLNRTKSYAEVSPSGRGIRVFGLATGTKADKRIEMEDGGHIEVYRGATRFLTVTGDQIGSCTKLVNIDDIIDELMQGGIKGAVKGDGTESGLFYKGVCKLIEQGLDVPQIVEHIENNPKKWEGKKVERFAKRDGGLRKAVNSCMENWRKDHEAQAEKLEAVKKIKWASGNVPKPCVADTRAAFDAMGLSFRRDTFHDRMLISGSFIKEEQQVDDIIGHKLRSAIFRSYGFDPGAQHIGDAMTQAACDNEFDPVTAYLDSLIWDGTERLDTWAVKYLGCRDNELTRTIGRLTLIAAVRRARKPGCKFDQIITLEGEEGISKSTAITILAGKENFSDQTILGLSDKEQQEVLRGRWLFEIADLRGIRHADVEHIKAFASRAVDRARPAFGRFVCDQPRRCVIFATTNDDKYLKSETGNRRWWPLKCTVINTKALKKDRDQLWAEAAAAEREWGEDDIMLPAHLWPLIKMEQDKRMEDNPLLVLLADVRGRVFNTIPGPEERVSTLYLLTEVLKLKASEANTSMGKRLSSAMKQLGWSGPRKMRVDGKSSPVQGWARPHEEPEIEEKTSKNRNNRNNTERKKP